MGPLSVGETFRICFGSKDRPVPNAQIDFYQHDARVKKIRTETLVLAVSPQLGDDSRISAGVPVALLKVTDDKLLVYKAAIRTIICESPLLLEVTRLKPCLDIQRRAFYRLGVQMVVSYSRVTGEESWKKAGVRDISEGGICLMETTQLPVGEQLVLELPLENESVCVRGFVRRCNTTGSVYMVGIEFSELTAKEQQKLRKFIFAQQLKRLKVTRQ